jgi:hypothetical protein
MATADWDFILNPEGTEARDLGTPAGGNISVDFPQEIADPSLDGTPLKALAWMLERVIARQNVDPGPVKPTLVSRSLSGTQAAPVVRYTVTLPFDGEAAIPSNIQDDVFNEII